MKERIAELIEEAESLRDARDRFEELSKLVRDLCKDELDDGDSEVGDFTVSKSSFETTRYDIPDKIKKKYAKKVEAIRISWKKQKAVTA